MAEPGRHGVIARFAGAAELIAAARHLQHQGFAILDAYTPYPVEALPVPAGRRALIPWITLIGGLLGLTLGLGLQEYATVLDYPLDIGGRPLDSWPMYLPTAYEFLAGTAVAFATAGLFALAGLPRYHHPVFAVPDFERASRDGFFLCVALDRRDARHHRLQEELTRCRALAVTDLPAG